MSNEKFLDPKQNPMIKIRPDDLPPIMEDDGLKVPFEEPLIPMGGYIYPEKKAEEAAAEHSPDLSKADESLENDFEFEKKVKDFMQIIDEVIIVRPVEGVAAFKIEKRQCGTLEVIDLDGSRRTLTALDPEERKIVNYNLYVKCAKGKGGECPCNQV